MRLEEHDYESSGMELTSVVRGRSAAMTLEDSDPEEHEEQEEEKEMTEHDKSNRLGDEALTGVLSAFYCKLLVVLGIAFPVTEVISPDTTSDIVYEGFYLFLYMGSLAFLLYMYATLMREDDEPQIDLAMHTPPTPPLPRRSSSLKGSPKILRSGSAAPGARRRSSVFGIELVTWRQNAARNRPQVAEHVRYGSFYLRVGVAAFGVGSVIYSGLEFGQHLELRSECRNLFLAAIPLFHIAFVLVQMLFIFTNNKMMEVYRYKVVAKFGLMHMIATNLCEWLYVLVEETKHDILALQANRPTALPEMESLDSSEEEFDVVVNSSALLNSSDCYKTRIMESLLEDASPFLFPCTVEYSLLCAVILVAMWKNVCRGPERHSTGERKSGLNVIYSRSLSYFSVDCASAYKGLFTSIVLMVVTIISLIMFLQLVHMPGYADTAVIQVNVWEFLLFASATSAAVALMFRVQRISVQPGGGALELEHVLLVVTQSGVFLYCMFQVIGGIFSLESGDGLMSVMNVLVPLGALVQSACQTLVLLDASRRRCDSPEQLREKPGRQLVTFLLVANLAIWAINRLKNSRVEFKPSQLEFYGGWAWAVITHVCVPLVVCYRFQSTVCLYEIWKRVYKMKANYI